MSIISEELSEIAATRKSLESNFKAGKMQPAEFYEIDLKYLTESAKRINSAIAIIVSATKHGRGIKSMADRIQLLDNTAINTGDPNLEMIKCPNNDKLISRAECLDVSGQVENHCSGCEHKLETQKRLL